MNVAGPTRNEHTPLPHSAPAGARARHLLALVVLLLVVAGVVAARAASNASAQQAAAGTWTTLAPTGDPRQEVSFTEAGGKLYLFGGTTVERQQVYDPAANSWRPTSGPGDLPGKLDHVHGVTVGGKIYYIGGLTSWPSPDVGTVRIYDPATDRWSLGADMGDRRRGGGGVAVHNGKIYYAGGIHDGAAVAWLDRYDPATNQWTQLPSMPTARDHFSAAILDGKLWAIGGRGGPGAIDNPTGVVEAYDIATNSWSKGAGGATYAPCPRCAAASRPRPSAARSSSSAARGACSATARTPPSRPTTPRRTRGGRSSPCRPRATGSRPPSSAGHLHRRGRQVRGRRQHHGRPRAADRGPAARVPRPARHRLGRHRLGHDRLGRHGSGTTGGGGTTTTPATGSVPACCGAPTPPPGPPTPAPPPGTTNPLPGSSSPSTASRRGSATSSCHGRGSTRSASGSRYGTTLRLTVSEPARIRLTVRRRSGRKLVAVKGSVSRQGRSGRNTVRFTGRIAGKRLAAGRYVLAVVAVDAAGNRSAVVRRSFSILTRPRART
jgi:N-acetylneuraminic acid mutarotase